LIERNKTSDGGVYEAQDGTSIVVTAETDASLPPALDTGATIRKTIYGVRDKTTLMAIGDELSKDREVTVLPDGSLQSFDDMGFAIGFQITVRKDLNMPPELINQPGTKTHRGFNCIGSDEDKLIVPMSLSHVVYFVPDREKMESFYRDRLGFRVVDRFTNLGPFMRPAGTNEHHTLFFIETPAHMQGVEHFTFHMSNPSDLMQAGRRFQEKGYESFWGPGRHILGSNWFWYFNSPFGVHIEYDADMDMHDDSWVPREVEASADSSQIFNFTCVDKWQPGADVEH
jgi:catechol 2,3-dioxygenase-like lactoylglutathione lyase family enzyme